MSATNKAYPVRSWLRVAVFIAGGLETAVMLAVFKAVLESGQLFSGEQLARSLSYFLLLVYGVPYLLCTVPALILAVLNRYVLAGLVLCLLAIPLVLIPWRA